MNSNSYFKIVLFFSGLLFFQESTGQAASYSDPAVAYGRLLLESEAPGFYRIGNFKVTGTPYLFGGKEAGNIYTETGKIENIKVRYNVYTQQVEADGEMGNEKFSVDFSGVDSFTLIPGKRVSEKMTLLKTAIFDSTERSFLMVMHRGKTYNLFKKYEINLRLSTSNIGQNDLRVFQLDYEYYYTSPAFYGIKKIKGTKSGIKKEFMGLTDMDAFSKQYGKNIAVQDYLLLLFEKLDNRP